MKTYLTPEDVESILSNAECVRDHLIVLLLWTTGMRVSELVGLKVEDLDSAGNVLTIRHLKTRGERYRQVPLRSDVSEELTDYIQRSEIPASERVFPLDRHTINNIIRGMCRGKLADKCLRHPESNLPHHISPHSFRSALAVHWLRRNGEVEGQKALQSMLGHQSFNTTARYFKLGLMDVKKVYEGLWSKAPIVQKGRR